MNMHAALVQGSGIVRSQDGGGTLHAHTRQNGREVEVALQRSTRGFEFTVDGYRDWAPDEAGVATVLAIFGVNPADGWYPGGLSRTP